MTIRPSIRYALGILAATASASSAHATVNIFLTEQGSDVLLVGNGSLELTGLATAGSASTDAGIDPQDGQLQTGAMPSSTLPVNFYLGGSTYAAPANFGPGPSNTTPTSGTGDRFTLSPTLVGVPSGYTSGSNLSFSNTFAGQTLATLGANPGTYTWSWGNSSTIASDGIVFTVGAPGSTIINPNAVTASSTFSVSHQANKLISNTGLSTPVTTGQTLTSATAATHDNDGGGESMWHSAIDEIAGVTLTFDLGFSRDVEGALIWQFNQTGNFDLTNRGVQDFTVAISDDNVNFTDLGQTFSLSESLGDNIDEVEIAPEAIDFGDQVQARYIRFTVESNYGGNVVGLSEVRFYNEAAIPEPGSLALLTLGGLFLARRRRRD